MVDAVIPSNVIDDASSILAAQRVSQPDYWHYWDSEPLTAAITTVGPFFQNVVGKNFLQTNLRQAPLPRPQIFTVNALGFLFTVDANTGGVVADNMLTFVISLLEDSRVTFNVGNKSHLEGALDQFAGGGGIYLTADQDTAAAPAIDAALTNGPPSPAHQVTLPWPIKIVHGEHFNVELTWGHAIDTGGLPAAAGRIFCFLEGTLDRGVVG